MNLRADSGLIWPPMTGGLVVVAVICLVAAGCSGDEDPLDGNGFGNQSTTNDTDVTDAGDGDAGPDADAGDDADADNGDNGNGNNGDNGNGDNGNGDNGNGDNGNGDNGNNDEPEPEFVDGVCGTMLELGEIPTGTTDVTVDFDDFDSDEPTNCFDDAADDRDIAIVSLDLLNRAFVSIDSDEPVAMELRFDSCLFPSGNIGCNFDELTNIPTTLGPDDSYIILEQTSETASSLQLEINLVDPPVCDDEGARSCLDDETAEVCRTSFAEPDDVRWYEGQCPTECSGGSCVGDSCDNPKVVDSSQTIEFDNWALFNEYDFHDHPEESCELPFVAEPSPGRDYVIELPALAEGDVVTIDVDFDQGDWQWAGWPFVAVKQTCSQQAACEELWDDENLDGELQDLTFEAPEDGDYYVFVDSSVQETDASFVVDVDIDD